MVEQAVSIISSLEARPAALFVQTASKYSSSIKVKIDDKVVNAKSIMGVISLGILDGHVVTIIAEGEDETQAVAELEKYLKMI